MSFPALSAEARCLAFLSLRLNDQERLCVGAPHSRVWKWLLNSRTLGREVGRPGVRHEVAPAALRVRVRAGPRHPVGSNVRNREVGAFLREMCDRRFLFWQDSSGENL